MFDIGMTELLVIGIVALIVVGPKDLPGLFRTLGRFTARARALGREFTRAMNEAADESGMKDVARDLKKATDPKSMGLDALKDAADKFEKWDPTAHPAAEHGKEVLEKSQKNAAAKAAERAAEPAQAQSMPEPASEPDPQAQPTGKSDA
ncbi:MAG TPA: twin-arginine translocase subunit TatB [Aliiroseovarius sp.]|nr:twin-arginine translocase subunit TatB [Aliiroseovarius sp.]